MTLLTDLPTELRQHIIRQIPGSMPDEVQLSHTGWPDPVKQLLATCKLLRADTIHIMSSWSFDCLIPRSGYIEHVPRLSRAIEALGLKNRIQRVRLLIFAEITMAYPREPENRTWEHLGALRRIIRKWKERCSKLPRGDIHTVVVDITPLPRSMLRSHPNLVHANLVDARTVWFFNRRWVPVAHIMRCLHEHFHPAAFELTPVMWGWKATEDGYKAVLVEDPPYMHLSVKVAIGGQIGEGSRSCVEELRHEGGISGMLIKNGAADFVGTYCDGEMPDHLSLHRLVQRYGIRLTAGGSETDYKVDVSGITLLDDVQENEIAPERDFSALSPLQLSKNSATAYYRNALDNEEAARKIVVKLLTFGVDCRQSLNTCNTPHLEFLPVTPFTRQLVRELSRDLGLLCSSIDGKYGKFQRVSSLVHEVNSRLNGIQRHGLEPPMEALAISHTAGSEARAETE
ncbi:hypothetical protein DHEL01_v210226 [Diaporthe helianthi]|uniref:Uncharacterized protein n=1 Tax=Diaporthe helianthi TaxID=158607 RepID=A0A2P5HMC8_DIAHE|nr:hypothetical protein DHEL01_v210226 [Diaporthe helianthi]